MKMLCAPTVQMYSLLAFLPVYTYSGFRDFQFTTQKSHQYTLKKERKKKRKRKNAKTVTFQFPLKQDLT